MIVMVKVVMVLMDIKNDRDDDDGCLDSVKNFFKNKQINVENFSISTRCRKSLYC